MSGQKVGATARVELVAWSGNVGQLAARLNLPAAELLKRLRPLAAGRKGERLVIMATPANSGPIMAAGVVESLGPIGTIPATDPPPHARAGATKLVAIATNFRTPPHARAGEALPTPFRTAKFKIILIIMNESTRVVMSRYRCYNVRMLIQEGTA